MVLYYRGIVLLASLIYFVQGRARASQPASLKQLASVLAALGPTASHTSRSEVHSPRQRLSRVLRVRGGKKESSALPVEDRLALQALGHAIGREKSDLSVLDASELDEVFAGVKAELLGEQSHVDFQSYAPKGVDILVDKWEALAEKTFQEGKQALERAVAEPGAKQTESGLVVQTLVEGVGDSPTLDQSVEIHLAGSLVDGTSIFTSTKEVGAPLVFEVGKLTKGLCEGLQLMKPGSKVKFTIPHELAYGDRYIPPNIPPKAVLVFHVELLDVK